MVKFDETVPAERNALDTDSLHQCRAR